jgi:hypothetical protein
MFYPEKSDKGYWQSCRWSTACTYSGWHRPTTRQSQHIAKVDIWEGPRG